MSRTPIAERKGRWSPGRVLSMTAALGVVAASLSIAQPAGAAVPSFPDNVVVFPDRDFISVEGYERYAGEQALVQVKRGSTVMGSAKVLVSGTAPTWCSRSTTRVVPAGGAGTGLDVTPGRTAHKVPGKSHGTGLSGERWQSPKNDETAGQKPTCRNYTSSFAAAESSQRVRGSSP